ncbi:MAG: right-handed parallel beta-helix repeat-containing protein [Bacteroidales bacterium]|nr:right-handed parallel beta-helix repeat-containing protein [Bacteroidales bacterium]
MKRLLLAVLVAACAVTSCSKKIYVKDYLTDEMRATDAGPAIQQAFLEALKTPGATLVLPSGVLPVREESCFRVPAFRAVCNHFCDRNILFEIDGIDGLRIKGKDTELLFTGYVMPVHIKDSKNISIEGVTIDYTHPFALEGLVLADEKDHIDLKFPDDYILEFEDGILRFRDDEGRDYPYCMVLEFDTEKKEVAYKVRDYIGEHNMRAERLEGNTARIFKTPGSAIEELHAQVGNTLVINALFRTNPVVYIEDSEHVDLTDFNIWCGCGCALTASRSGDIKLERYRVEAAPGSGRLVSTTADATHFENCYGYVRMIDCVFKNQMDDATNFHSRYNVALENVASNKLRVWSINGWNVPRPGDVMDIADWKTLSTYDTLRVNEIECIAADTTILTFDKDIPACYCDKDVLSNLDTNPEVLIKGCTISSNRARGLLLGSRGKTIVEDCYFHTSGTACTIEGDGTYWFEDSASDGVIIRNNVFDNCVTGLMGNAAVSVCTRINDKENSRYHKNIVIEGNTFKSFDPRAIYLYCVDGVTIRNNTFISTEDYPCPGPAEPVQTPYCDNVMIE